MKIKHPLFKFFFMKKKDQRAIAKASLYSFLNKVTDLAPPLLIGAAVDTVVKKESSFLGSVVGPDLMTQLYILGGMTVLIWSLESLFEFLQKLTWRGLAQEVQHDLRMDGYNHLQNLDLEYFEHKTSGSLMALLNDDVNQFERFLNGGANDIIQVMTTVLIVGTGFLVIAPNVALFSFIPIPLILWFSFSFKNKVAPHYARVREEVDALNSKLGNNLSGMTTIKSYTAEHFESWVLNGLSENYNKANKLAIRLSSAFSPIIRIFIVLSFTTTLIMGGKLVIEGSLNVGAYSVMIFLTQRLLWPLTRLGETFDLYQRSMASLARLIKLLNTSYSIKDGRKLLNLKKVKGDIKFHKIFFNYRGLPPLFEDFNFHIKAQKTFAIVGPTGSGKSTLTKLILRLYESRHGFITLDGEPISNFSLKDLRKAFSFVGQDVFLFHGTVRENISYGSFNSTLDDIIEAAKMAEAHQFISELPQGYETVIGERGQTLSGGQRQRISIARALLKNAPVLILDEATSNVDNETEASLQRTLEKASHGRTTLILAHRLSTIRHADHIIVLEKGKIVEEGAHDELLRLKGFYKRLWDVQTGEKKFFRKNVCL